MSLDGAERKIKALTRLVNAQERGLINSPVIITTDSSGSTPEGAERLLTRELAYRGLERTDLEDAGLKVIHVNLPWASGRNLRFGDKAAGLCDEDGKSIKSSVGGYDPSTCTSDTQSAGLNVQNQHQQSDSGNCVEESGWQSPRMLPNG